MRDYYKEAYQKSLAEQMRTSSMQGPTLERNKDTITIDRRTYHARLRRVAIVSAIAAGLIVGAANPVINKMQDENAVKALSQDFKVECLDTATPIFQDEDQHYIDIANYITNEFYDFDIGVYLLDDNTNENEVEEVLQRTYFGSTENYLQSINYKDMKAFGKDMYDRIAQDDEIYSNKVELRDMIEGHRNEIYGLEDRAGLLH